MISYKTPEFINKDDWLHSLDNGLVRVRKHPTEDLLIANYTERAQFQREWNTATKNCRGLIFDFDGEVHARPFPKFHNWDEADRPMIPGGPVRVQDKMGGSLGIIYRLPSSGEYAVATRGSFESEQALHATEILNTHYSSAPILAEVGDFTPLVEIVYPDNRVVVDYKDEDDLYLLDIIDNKFGNSFLMTLGHRWTGPEVPRYEFSSLDDVIKAPQEPNREGFVVFFYKTNERVKVKFEDYKRLHKIRFGFSNVAIWEAVKEGKELQDIIDGVPDEFHAEVKQVWDEIVGLYLDIVSQAHAQFGRLLNTHRHRPEDPRASRKDFAQLVQDRIIPEWRGMMFALFDGRDISDYVMNLIKPDHQQLFMTYPGEDS